MNTTFAGTASEPRTARPRRYLVRHPWQYRLAVTAATAAAATGYWLAARSTGRRRIWLALLAAAETAAAVGIIDAADGSVSARFGLIRPLD